MNYIYRLVIFLVISIAVNSSTAMAFDSGTLHGREFIENKGQLTDQSGKVRGDILFYAEGTQNIVYFRESGISYVSFRSEDEFDDSNPNREYTSNRTDIEFIGSASSIVSSFEEIEFKRNYYLSHCPQGITNVRAFKKIRYENVWQGIDLEFYFDGAKNLKYDYIVKANADISQIKLEYKGQDEIKIDDNGNLLLINKVSNITEKTPFTYQEISESEKSEIKSSYNLQSNRLSFDISNYDKSKELVIDPSVQWSTFYGGILHDWAHDIIIDSNKDLLITGKTFSNNFPVTSGTEQTTWAGDYDAFIIKMTKEGNRLWATYFGGSLSEISKAICEDVNDDLIIVGYTWSEDFPVDSTSHQEQFAGGFEKTDAFIAKFDTDGHKIWSTYYGGEKNEHFYDVETDSEANIVITGWTNSSDFQVEDNEFKRSSLVELGLLVKMDSDGQYIWATHFGGTEKTNGHGVDVDSNDDIYFTGFSSSAEFPTTFNQSDIAQEEDVFLAKFTSAGQRVWSRLYGGTGNDKALSLILMAGDTLAIVGETRSNDIDLGFGKHQTLINTGGDCLISTFTIGGDLLWSTYWGGSAKDRAMKVNKDIQNNILVTGFTESSDFPITSTNLDLPHSGLKDALVLKFTLDGNDIYWSTALGGLADEYGEGIVADDSSRVYVTGFTESTDFPIVGNAFQDEYAGYMDVFVARLCATNPDPQIEIMGSDSLCEGEEVELDAGVGYLWYKWSTGETTQKITVSEEGDYYVTISDTSGCEAQSDPVHIYVFPNPDIEISGDIEICEGDTTELWVEGIFDSFLWSDDSEAYNIFAYESGKYSVTVVDSNGCTGTAEVNVFLYPLPNPTIKGHDEVCSFTENMSYYLDNSHTNHNYNWEIEGGTLKTGQDTKFITVDWDATGTGKVIVHDTTANGCVGHDTLIITIREELIPEIVSSSGSFMLCEGDTIVLSSKNKFDDYLWNDTDNAESIKVWESGNIKVWVRDESGCEGENAININVIPAPNDTIIGQLELCYSDEIFKYNTYQQGNHLYLWEIVGGTIESGENSPEIEVRWDGPGTGTITLTGTDTRTGCSGESQIEVIIYDNPSVEITFEEELEFCEGDSVLLSFDGQYTDFYWEDSSTDRIRMIKISGTYSLTVLDDNGCEAYNEVDVTVYPLPPKPTITDLGGVYESSSANAYQWYFGGIQIGGATGQQHIPTVDGAYQVVIFDENRCSNISDPINFNSGQPYSSFSIPDTIFAGTGDALTIPLVLVRSDYLNKYSIFNYKAYLRFNRTLLMPSDKYAEHYLDQYEKVIVIEGTRTINDGVLEYLEFTALWGNDECTDMIIDSVVWEDDDVIIDLKSGVFCIDDLCEADGTRLYIGTDILSLAQNRPNPASNSTTIEVVIIEEGEHFISIYDSFGNLLIKNSLGSGAKRELVNFDLTNWSSGVYYYTLYTPFRTITKRMLIVK